ncbi:MAG: metalloregulator ArsR/SmtB family transcription factor [Caldilineaceae bacterium]
MESLLSTLKELADPTRFTILGLLAQAPRSGDELAALLDIKPSTISHHLTRLQKVGLVNVQVEQYYHVYTLNAAALERPRTLLTPQDLAEIVALQETINDKAYQEQILVRWIEDDRLQGLPTQIKQRQIVLQWLQEKFEPDRRYTVRQLDDVLARWCNWQDGRRLDITTVTRALVDGGMLERTANGSIYWRADSPLVQAAAHFSPDNLLPADTLALHLPLVSSPLRRLVQIAMRIKANRAYSTGELIALLKPHCQDSTESVPALQQTLLDAGLLQQKGEEQFVRPTIGPDHPAQIKLREEATMRATV